MKEYDSVMEEILAKILELQLGGLGELRGNDELSRVAACYATPPEWRQYRLIADDSAKLVNVPILWPWDAWRWQPQSKRQNLVLAAAYALIEIERIDKL